MKKTKVSAEDLKDLCFFYLLAEKKLEEYRNCTARRGLQYEMIKLLGNICEDYLFEIDELFDHMSENCGEDEMIQLKNYYLRHNEYNYSKSGFYKMVERAIRGLEDEIREKTDRCLVQKYR